MNNNDSDQTDITNLSDSINLNVATNKQYTFIDKTQIIKRITDIKIKKCYIKIFKLIHNDNLNYTKNDNGVFFNITNLSNTVLSNIDTILTFYEEKRKEYDNLYIKHYNNNNNYNIFTEDSDIIL